ncbi:MAG: hypothetical protein ACUVRJ_10960, partial [Candidatus Villigracilaceae bacterium]
FSGDKAIATLSLMRWQDYITIGNASVLSEYRRSLPILAMAVKTVLGQTVLDPLFERFLRFFGFSYAFKRIPYVLA